MEELGQFIAYSVPSQAFRRLIEAQAAQRFDGDANVLFNKLLEQRIGDESVRSALAARYAEATGVSPAVAEQRLTTLVSNIDRLHVGVYGLDTWDPDAYEPRVAVEPLGINDTDVERVKAYGPDGDFVWLDAQDDPAFPVLYVGINERTDDAGNVLPDYLPSLAPPPCEGPGGIDDPPGGEGGDSGCDDGGGGGGGGGTGGGGSSSLRAEPSHPEVLYKVTIRDDNEPFWKGGPEIKFQANGSATPAAELYRGDLNKGEGTHTIERRLFFWNPSNMGYFYAMRWWEEDPGTTIAYNVSLSGKSGPSGPTTVTVGFTFTWKDDDDDMGAVANNFDDPLQAYYDTGDVKWNMK